MERPAQKAKSPNLRIRAFSDERHFVGGCCYPARSSHVLHALNVTRITRRSSVLRHRPNEVLPVRNRPLCLRLSRRAAVLAEMLVRTSVTAMFRAIIPPHGDPHGNHVREVWDGSLHRYVARNQVGTNHRRHVSTHLQAAVLRSEAFHKKRDATLPRVERRFHKRLCRGG